MNGDETLVSEIRERYGINMGNPMIFYIGDFSPSENIEALIKAMPNVINEFPDSKLVLLSEDVLPKELKDFVERPEMRGNVIVRTEYVSEQEKIAHYISANVAVFPSTWKPFGRACTEALACGTPVVSTRFEGIPIFFSDGFPGLTYLDNFESIPQTVGRVLASDIKPDPTRLSKFSWDRTAARLSEFYKKILTV